MCAENWRIDPPYIIFANPCKAVSFARTATRMGGAYDPLSTPTRKYVHTFDMAEEAGYTFSLLDVGGGFKDSPIEQAATYMNNAVDRYSLIGVV